MTKGEQIMYAAVEAAQRMHEGSADFTVKLWGLPVGPTLMICYQHEESGPTWWVRHFNQFGNLTASHYCTHIAVLMGVVAHYVSKEEINI